MAKKSKSARTTKKKGENTDIRHLHAIKRAKQVWDKLTPEAQWMSVMVRKCHTVHSIRSSDSVTLEESAHRALTSEVSEKFADWMLRKRKFRKALGLT